MKELKEKVPSLCLPVLSRYDGLTVSSMPVSCVSQCNCLSVSYLSLCLSVSTCLSHTYYCLSVSYIYHFLCLSHISIILFVCLKVSLISITVFVCLNMSVSCDRLRQKSWSPSSASCVAARKIVRRSVLGPVREIA